MKKILCLIAVVFLIDVSLGFSQEEEIEETPDKKELLKDAKEGYKGSDLWWVTSDWW